MLWTRWREDHPQEDTLEIASRFNFRKVRPYMRRVGLRVEEAESVVDFLAYGNSHAGHVAFKFRMVADFSVMTRDLVRATWLWWRPSLPHGGTVVLPAARGQATAIGLHGRFRG